MLPCTVVCSAWIVRQNVCNYVIHIYPLETKRSCAMGLTAVYNEFELSQ